MSGQYLKQSTASQQRILGPFLDDTDFKTAEIALTIANTDIKLMKNGAASVNKNSGGGTHRVNGFYGATFNATDTNTVGELEVSVKMTGALPIWKTFYVLEEAVYDLLFGAASSGKPTLDAVTHAGAVIPTVSVLTTLPAIPTNWLTAAGIAATALDGKGDWNTITPNTVTPLNATGIRSAMGLAGANLDTQLGTLALASALATVDSNVDAIKVITDALGATAASRLAISAGQMLPATVDTVTNTHTPTTTIFQADDVSEATTGHYNGRVIIFTSGVLIGQATDITAYSQVGGIGQFTVTAMTEAPADNDTFIII